MRDRPRSLLVNDNAEYMITLFKDEFGNSVNFASNADEALSKYLSRYRIATIDASDDTNITPYYSLSEWLKLKNPNLIIIGTSIDGENFFKDELSRQLYDEQVSFLRIDYWIKQIKELLETKYAFDFSSEEN